MMISTTSIGHIRLNVSDIARSQQFYDNVFGWSVVTVVPADADAATRDQMGLPGGGVIYELNQIWIILRAGHPGSFDRSQVGLDHIAFNVAGKDELDAAAARLDQLAVDHDPVVDVGPIYSLQFRDPDNITLELSAPK